MIFSKHQLWCGLLATALVWMLPGTEASANGGAWGGSGGAWGGSGGGSWGSSGGGSWGSSGGGSWGSSGGILGGRRPVRNLLSRVCDRIQNIGRRSWGSSGGCSGGSFGSCTGGSWGGSSGGSSWGSSGGGSFGSYVAGNSFASSNGLTSTSLSETSQHTPVAGSNFTLEQSYPVGDQGFVPGLPAYNSYTGQNLIGGQTVEEAFNGGLVAPPTPAGDSSSILDGGPIDALLENSTLPVNGPDGSYYNGIDRTSPNPGPKSNDGTFLDPRERDYDVAEDEAILRLNVPVAAKVYVNGKLTTTTGAIRSYETKNLTAEQVYRFKVKAVLQRDGKQLVRSKMISLRAGQLVDSQFDFDAPATTVLTLNVPEDAKVTLCGSDTQLTGTQRRFITTQLADGQICDDYEVKVEYKKGGQTVTRVRTIKLAAGDLATLTFGKSSPSSQADQLAVR